MPRMENEMERTFILDEPISLKGGRRGHYAGTYNNGVHYIFTKGRTSWTIPQPENLCENHELFEVKDVIEVKAGYFNDVQ